MTKLRALLLAAVLEAVACAQSFEVATLKPAAPGQRFGNLFHGGPGTSDPARFTGADVSLSLLLQRAFGVQADQIARPDWTDTVRLELAATVPAGATEQQLNVMLQNLLAERLHMTFHKIRKNFPAFTLTVAPGKPKLKPAEGETKGPAVSVHASCTGDHLVANNKAMAGVALALRSAVGARVIDKTGLAGNYDVDLYVGIDHSNSGMMRCNGQLSDAPPPPEAVEKQLGLRLEKTSVQLDVFVIDHLDTSPADN